MTDPLALAIAFGYVSVVLAVGEGLRRGLQLSVEFSRKFVHLGVGMVAFALVAFFREWYFAIIPPLVFVGVNYVSYRRQIFAGMETGEKNQLGTVYFPISFSILIPLFWSQPTLLVASLMPMTWGDAFAAIVGKKVGSHTYTVFGQTRSLEGSIAMFVFSYAAVALALVVFGEPVTVSLISAGAVASAATLAEAASPWGIDNLTVPLVSAVALVLMNRK